MERSERRKEIDTDVREAVRRWITVGGEGHGNFIVTLKMTVSALCFNGAAWLFHRDIAWDTVEAGRPVGMPWLRIRKQKVKAGKRRQHGQRSGRGSD